MFKSNTITSQIPVQVKPEINPIVKFQTIKSNNRCMITI